MARFGQGLFSGSAGTGLNMMNAQLAQVGQNLGAAVPTARRVMQERQDETQFRQLMSQAQQALASKDSSALATIAAGLSQIGKQEQAMALSQAAQKLSSEQAAQKQTEDFRGVITDLASSVPGLEGVAATAAVAPSDYLDDLSKVVTDTTLAAQQRKDRAAAAASTARSVGVSPALVKAFGNDPESLASLSQSVAQTKQTEILNKASEAQQITTQVKRAEMAGLPQEEIEEVRSGAYVGRNAEFTSLVSGKDSSSGTYQYTSGDNVGQLVTLPSRGSKVLVNNKWVYPNEVGLIEGPKVSAETSIPKFQSRDKAFVGAAGLASGVAKSFIESLDNMGQLQSQIGTKAVNFTPLQLDFTKNLEAFRDQVPEVLLRMKTGAAIREDEIPRYERMFAITGNDFVAPVSTAEKVIRTSALIATEARLLSGEISPREARALLEEAGSITLSEKDREAIRSNNKNSLKKVVKKYTDPLFDEGSGASSSQVDDILKSLGIN